LAYRPGWYKNDARPAGAASWFGNLPGWGVVLVVTFGVWLLQMLFVKLYHIEPLSEWMGIRAWWPTALEGVRDPAGRTLVDPNNLSFNWLFPIQTVTYMLVHDPTSIGHVFFNMLFVFFFGRGIEAQVGRAGFFRLYLAAGIAGGLACWLAALLAGSPIPTIGASGAVYGVMVLYAFKWPRHTIFIYFMPVPIWLFVAWRVFSDLQGFLIDDGTHGVAYLAHLLGATVGYVWFKRGDVVWQADLTRRRHKAEKQSQQSADSRREMDRILGKIQAQGLGSLSAKERGFLDRRSKELRESGR